MQFNIKKIIFNCRRGMLELDVILIPFAERYFDGLTEVQKHSFVDLLEEADPDIYTWVMGFGKPELKFADIIACVREKMEVA